MANVRINYRKTDIYDRLVDEEGIFDSYVDLFVFAACRAYAEGERHQDNYKGDAEMLWMHFGNKDFHRAAAACIAYQTTNDPSSLMDHEEQLTILAQYASAGADILKDDYGEVKGSPLNSLMNDVKQYEPDSDKNNEGGKSALEKLREDMNM